MADEVESMLKAALKELNEEEKEDEEIRNQYGTIFLFIKLILLGMKWLRTPSSTLASQLRQELLKHQTNLNEAVKSDSYILDKINQNQEGVDMLCQNPVRLIFELCSSALATSISITTQR